MNDSDWAAVVRDLNNVDDVDVMVAAAERLRRTATPDDLPRVRTLLLDDSFFVREAAAWPLSELAGATALPELFQAYQRGFDEGHDNDGFTTALIELAAADPDGVRQVLEMLVESGNEAMRENAAWLMEFCEKERDAQQWLERTRRRKDGASPLNPVFCGPCGERQRRRRQVPEAHDKCR